MNLPLQIALAALVAGAIGAAGPRVLSRLPEPEDPADDKLPYADVARIRGALPWMSGLAAVSAALMAWQVESSEYVPIWILLAGVGSWLAFVDWHTRYLPKLITGPMYVGMWLTVGLAALLLRDTEILLRTALANAVVFVVFVLIFILGKFFADGFGYGDVRLAAIIAVALGPLGGVVVGAGLWAGFVVGAIGGILMNRLKFIDGTTFAFGPYLLIGALIGVLWAGSLGVA